MLQARNITKSFQTQVVLRGVDLSVEKGDVVAILGPSGSGKTTLLRCLNFLETADGGTLEFDGEIFQMGHVSKKDIARLRKKTAFVFQNYNLFRNKTAILIFPEMICLISNASLLRTKSFRKTDF